VKKVQERLSEFEPVEVDDEPEPLDISFAEQFLKVFSRMAKAQWKTQKKADLSAQKVSDYLDEHGDLIDDLKRQRTALRDENEQLRGFVLEVVDLIEGFRKTAEKSGDSEMRSAAETMREALESSMEKIGLQRIPALGEVPDGDYHFVLDTTDPDTEEERDRIVEVVEQGYTHRGEVLRKANVIVAK
jgi:molecular chaperone GrpE (heat shock protein)